ncbi:hypothetical protein GGI07_005451 [Coemansia sp. Benny D115]|nr:hypothetical protein GGI07_005451 [Coemansia sp. Benny D115]
MARILSSGALRAPVAAALVLWLLFMAVLGFTQLVRPPVSDKALHFVAFGVMGVLLVFVFRPAVPRRRVWLLAVGCTATAAVLSEALQALLTTRVFDWADVAANLLGGSTFLFAAWMVDRWIVQPRARSSAYGGSARYWALGASGSWHSPGGSLDGDLVDELDVELDEILVAQHPQPQRPPRQAPRPGAGTGS